jgi:hypothetical protein
MRWSGMMLRSGCVLAVLATAATAGAIETISGKQEIDFDRPESWAMKYYASLTLMTSIGPPRPLALGQLRVAIEGEWIPEVSDEQRVVGFNGTKAEDLNKLPAIGRLRMTVGLPWKLSLTVSYLPPISINGVEPNLLSLSLGRPFELRRNLTLGVATYGQYGFVEGAFTCPDSAVRAGGDPARNPFGCLEVSQDHVDLNYLGLELSASYRIVPAHRLEPYVSMGVNYLNLGFRVDARYGDVLDHTHLATHGVTFSTATGFVLPITRRLDLAAEAFYSPLTVQRPPHQSTAVEGLFNVRGLIAYRFF